MSAHRSIPDEDLPVEDDPEVRKRYEASLRELSSAERPAVAIAVGVGLACIGAVLWTWVRSLLGSNLSVRGIALAVGFGWFLGWATLRAGRVHGRGWTGFATAMTLVAFAIGDFVGGVRPWERDLGDVHAWLDYGRVMAWVFRWHPLDGVVAALTIGSAAAAAHAIDPAAMKLWEARLAVYDERAAAVEPEPLGVPAIEAEDDDDWIFDASEHRR